MGEVKQISSLQNPTVKQVRALMEQRKERRESGLFAAEGIKVVATARDLGWTPSCFLFGHRAQQPPIFEELLQWAQSAGALCLEVTEAVLSKLSTRDNPQGVIAVFPQKWTPLSDATSGLWIALEEVRDPGNLGTIVRTADAAGAKGVILVGNCCDPHAREAVRASMGSIFAVPLVKTAREDVLQHMKDWPGETVGTHLSGAVDFRRGYHENTLLVMGSEGPGLSDETAKACSTLVKIPMRGAADSLNLSVATGLVVYEIRRGALGLG